MKSLLTIVILLYSTKECRFKVRCEDIPTLQQLTLSQEIELALMEDRNNYEFIGHLQIVNEFYDKRKNWVTSNVGTIIFKDPRVPSRQYTEVYHKTFVVYIYNQWSILYTDSDLNNESLSNMLNNCSVHNCIFTRDKKHIDSADVILVNVHKGQYPRFYKTNPKQKWVLFSMESPANTFAGYKFKRKLSIQNLSGVFDWIMTYRLSTRIKPYLVNGSSLILFFVYIMRLSVNNLLGFHNQKLIPEMNARSDSDVPVPFGRTIPLLTPIEMDFSNAEHALSKLVPFWKLKQHKILVVTMVSNCIMKNRIRFIRSLMKLILVDTYGDCAFDRLLKKSCPGYVKEDCSVLEHYFFYLVLENSGCRQYLTEKVFHNSYSKGAIPIIWGAPLQDCQKLLPPDSYLHVDYYNSYEHLASHIIHISQNKKELLKYHAWRKHFKVVNEHGFFRTQPMQFCRLCEALNYNDHPSHVYNYDDLRLFFDKNLTCISI